MVPSTTKFTTCALAVLVIGWHAAAACRAAEESGATARAAAQTLLAEAGVRGGLIVHLGCGDGKLTAALRAGEGYTIHGLGTDPAGIEAARRTFRSRGLDGSVSVEHWTDDRLPYTDNLVNLVVCQDPAGIPISEVMRVLSPGGVAMIEQGGQWKKTVKPWPEEIDQWTHFLYDASGNAVAKDSKVGPPRHVQWAAAPARSRDHDALASLSAMTSSNGRLFQICDEGPVSLIHHAAQWRLVARDAFNGTVLWRREIGSWLTHLYYFWSGHVQLPRRLVSIGDRVYVTLGIEAPVTMLDAATGQTLLTFAGSEKTEEIICHDGVLLAAIGDPDLLNRESDTTWNYWPRRADGQTPAAKTIVAYRAGTGDVLWKKTADNLAYLVPLSLAAAGRRAFFLDQEHLCCVDLHTGKDLWNAPCPIEGRFRRNYTPTLVVHEDAVVVLTAKRLAAFSAVDGKPLWHKDGGNRGYASPGDLFVIGSVAWTLPATGNNDFWGIDLRSGTMEKTFVQDQVWPGGHHHRCYRNKATEQYLVTGRRGLEYISLTGRRHVHNWWIRGECQYGVLPCNGLTYVPPDPCTCFNFVKVDGFYALAAGNSLDETSIRSGKAHSSHLAPRDVMSSRGARRLLSTDPLLSTDRGSDEWPTYRHDATRSGSTTTRVPSDVRRLWATDVGSNASSPVVADGKLLTASTNQHTVSCLDAETGEPCWRFVANGPVDSPPTIFGQLAIFGSRDGHVYAVRLADGKLVWRFRGAAIDRRICVDGRLESVWPIHGSVLVLPLAADVAEKANAEPEGVVYFAAGRSSYLDGGIDVFGLDAHTGRQRYHTSLAALPHEPGNDRREETPAAALPDVLVSDGRQINMRQVQFDRSLARCGPGPLHTLFSTTGLLEDCWAHRHNWSLGCEQFVGGGDPVGGTREGMRTRHPMGKLIVFDEQYAYGVQSYYSYLKHTRSMWPAWHEGELHQKYATYEPRHFPVGVRLFAKQRPVTEGDGKRETRQQGPPPGKNLESHSVGQRWAMRVPLQVRAMVLTPDVLFLAGWHDSVAIEMKTGVALDPPVKPADRAELWAVSPADGKRLARYPLDSPPTFDGLIAAGGRLYLSTADGKVRCFAGGGDTK